MFRVRTLALVLGVLVLFSPNLFAGTNVWAENYPKRTKTGDILIQGVATADACNTLGATGTALVWPAGRKGGIVTTTSITVNTCNGTWSATITGLDPKIQYVVVVQVTETGSCACAVTNTIATQPRLARARDDDQGDDD